jgi:hypothetical protein
VKKSAKNNWPIELKSHRNQSHNQDSQLIALVKCLARQAAEKDNEAVTKRKLTQNIRGEQ